MNIFIKLCIFAGKYFYSKTHILETYKIIKKEILDSTNNYLKNIIKSSGKRELLCVTAEEQTAGKGQAENSWHSEKGKNLLFSMVLYPEFLEVSKQFFLSKIISIALVNVLNKIQKGFKIKWPNDIYYKDKKIAGILIENLLSADKINRSIVGIGININQENFPSEIPNPTSLTLITSLSVSKTELLTRIINSIQTCCKLLINQLYSQIAPALQQC